MNTAPIYIVDDDAEDEDFIRDAFKELCVHNELRFFGSADEILKELAQAIERNDVKDRIGGPVKHSGFTRIA